MFNLLKSCFFSPFFNFLDIIKYYLNRLCFFPIKKSYYVYRKEGSMKDKVVDSLMVSIKNNNNFDNVKLEEIRYGLCGLYSLTTKTVVIILLAYLLNICKELLMFLLFYSILRSVCYGAHAKTNLQCWIFSVFLLITVPYIFIKFKFSFKFYIISWCVLFIVFLVFAPADTDKRPMISKKRKYKFKIVSLLICVLYLIIIFLNKEVSNIIISAMFMEAFLISPISYIIMGQKVRFKLNDINLFKQR